MVKNKIANKQRIFVDMDGVLAIFIPGKSIEELCQPGYFKDLPPCLGMVKAIQQLLDSPVFEIYTLSHYLCPQALSDKQTWLDRHLPTLQREHRIFVPYGDSKCEYIPDGYRPDDVLLDDFSPNLRLWSSHGIAIKVLNGMNWSKKTWGGHVVSALADEKIIATAIYAIATAEKANGICTNQLYHDPENEKDGNGHSVNHEEAPL